MNLNKYKDVYCQCCKQCEGGKYHQSHCMDIDTLEGTWEICSTELADRACEILYRLVHDEGCDIKDIEKAKEIMEKELCKDVE